MVMYDDLLDNYNEDEYVYIIEGCMNYFVSKTPASDKPCDICGDYDWPVVDGYVEDIRNAKDKEELVKIKQMRLKKQM